MLDKKKLHAVFEVEPPPPPQVLIPNTGIDNSINFTSPTLTFDTVNFIFFCFRQSYHIVHLFKVHSKQASAV